MTRTARALVIGPAVGLGSWATAVAAAPAASTPVDAKPIAAHRPASAGLGEALTLPVLSDVVAPLVLAALFGTVAAWVSAGPRQTARARDARRRRRI
jgi:hypothetical protein